MEMVMRTSGQQAPTPQLNSAPPAESKEFILSDYARIVTNNGKESLHITSPKRFEQDLEAMLDGEDVALQFHACVEEIPETWLQKAGITRESLVDLANYGAAQLNELRVRVQKLSEESANLEQQQRIALSSIRKLYAEISYAKEYVRLQKDGKLTPVEAMRLNADRDLILKKGLVPYAFSDECLPAFIDKGAQGLCDLFEKKLKSESDEAIKGYYSLALGYAQQLIKIEEGICPPELSTAISLKEIIFGKSCAQEILQTYLELKNKSEKAGTAITKIVLSGDEIKIEGETKDKLPAIQTAFVGNASPVFKYYERFTGFSVGSGFRAPGLDTYRWKRD